MLGKAWQAELYDYILLAVASDKGMMGWPQDIDANMVNPYHPVLPSGDVLVYAKVPTAPLADVAFTLQAVIETTQYATATASIKVFKREQQSQTGTSDWKQETSIRDFLVDGNAEWQGDLRQGVPVQIKINLKLPESDWWIA